MIISLDWKPTVDGWVLSDCTYQMLRSGGASPVASLRAMCEIVTRANMMACLPDCAEVDIG